MLWIMKKIARICGAIHLCTRSILPCVLLLGVFLSQNLVANPVEFTVATADKPLNSDDLRGSVVYVDFWASWCTPCRKSFPWMNNMQEKYSADGLIIIAINLDKDVTLARDFLRKLPAEFVIGFDPEAVLAKQFDVIGMPSAYILNREGEIISRHIGFRTANVDEYEQAIQQALANTQ